MWTQWTLKLFQIRKVAGIMNEMNSNAITKSRKSTQGEPMATTRTGLPSGMSAVSTESWVARDLLMTSAARQWNSLQRTCHSLHAESVQPSNKQVDKCLPIHQTISLFAKKCSSPQSIWNRVFYTNVCQYHYIS